MERGTKPRCRTCTIYVHIQRPNTTSVRGEEDREEFKCLGVYFGLPRLLAIVTSTSRFDERSRIERFYGKMVEKYDRGLCKVENGGITVSIVRKVQRYALLMARDRQCLQIVHTRNENAVQLVLHAPQEKTARRSSLGSSSMKDVFCGSPKL